MFTVTLSKGRGKGEMKRDSHPLARQHSGGWHLFLRFYKPHWQIWNTRRTQNQYSHFGLKAAAEFAGSAWESGWRGGLSTNSCLGPCGCLLLKREAVPWQRQRVQETVQKSTRCCTRGDAALWPLSVQRPTLAKDSSHEEMWGHHQLEMGKVGHGNPKWMLLLPIQPTPPHLSKAPFTVCLLK